MSQNSTKPTTATAAGEPDHGARYQERVADEMGFVRHSAAIAYLAGSHLLSMLVEPGRPAIMTIRTLSVVSDRGPRDVGRLTYRDADARALAKQLRRP